MGDHKRAAPPRPGPHTRRPAGRLPQPSGRSSGSCRAVAGPGWVLPGTARRAAGGHGAPGAGPGVREGGGLAPAFPALQPPLCQEEKQVAFGAKGLAPPLIFMEIKRAG